MIYNLKFFTKFIAAIILLSLQTQSYAMLEQKVHAERDLWPDEKHQASIELGRAIILCNVDAVRFLVEEGGADINNIYGQQIYYDTPLIRAVQKITLGTAPYGKFSLDAALNIFSYLASHKDIDINKADSVGQTALHVAAENGNFDAVVLLINKGAQVDSKDWNGDTPLINAAWNNHARVMQLLLENKADINKQNLFGETALLKASRRRNTEAVQCLLEAGADKDIRNKYGASFEDYIKDTYDFYSNGKKYYTFPPSRN